MKPIIVISISAAIGMLPVQKCSAPIPAPPQLAPELMTEPQANSCLSVAEPAYHLRRYDKIARIQDCSLTPTIPLAK